MPALTILAAVAPTAARSVRHWIFHLGAAGFIPLGLIDASVIPLPGSMDLLTVVLCAQDGHWWLWFAVAATGGSVLGGWVTYHLARKGGKEMLERRFSKKQLAKVYKIFHRSGFGAVAIPALLPPPAPMVLFLFAAGAMQYPVRKFLAALTLGRLIRYTILAYLAQKYGRHILRFFSAHAIVIGLIGFTVFAGMLFYTMRKK
jgi:membrane protein YqaA with SNARE-associated domain